MELKREELARIKEALRANPRGMNVTEIAKEIGVNRLTAAKYLDLLVVTGHVDMKEYGPSKVYFLSQRMPISAMLSLSSDFIIMLDKDSNIINVNDRFIDFTGVGRDTLLYKNIKQFRIPAALKPSFIPNIKEAIDGKESTVEAEYKKDGKTSYYNVKLIPIVFDEGDRGVIILMEDITERKRIETAIRESEEKFRGIIEQSLDGIMLFDTDGTIIECNKGIEHITGIKPEENLGKKLWETEFILHVKGEYNSDYTTEAGLNNLKKFILEYIKTGVSPLGIDSFELTFTRPYDEKRVVLFNYFPIKSERGNMLCTMARDITERKMAEEELRKSEANLAKAQKIAHMGNWEWDVEKNTGSGSVEAYKIQGMPSDQKVDSLGSFMNNVHPEDRDLMINAVSKAINEKSQYRFDYRVVWPDSTVRYVHSEGEAHCDKDGKTTKVFGIVQDVTDLKQKEMELAYSEEKFRTLAETTSAGILIFDEDLIYLNHAVENITGYTMDEFKKLNTLDIIHPDHMETLNNKLQLVYDSSRAIDSKTDARFELKIIKKDGTEAWVDATTGTLNFQGNFVKVVTFFDITERKQAEEELKEREDRLKKLLDASPVPMIISEGKCQKTTYVNAKFTETFGYMKEEVPTANDWFRLAFPDQGYRDRILEMWSRELAEIINNKTDLTTPESTVTCKDGSTRVVTISISSIGDQNILIFNDITEHKRSEEVLRASEEKFRVLAETSPTAIFVHRNDKALYANKAAEAISGYTRDELMRINYFDLVHPEYREQLKQRSMARIHGQPAPDRYETKIIVKDGSEKWVEITAGRIDYMGGPAALILIQDNTERKRTEDALRSAEERFRNLVESVSDMIWETGKDFVFSYVNPRALEATGYEPHEVIGKRIFDFMPPEEADRFLKTLVPLVIAKKSITQLTCKITSRGGNPVYLEISGNPIFNANGEVRGYRGIARDVSERKRAEEAIRSAEDRYRNLVESISDIIWETDRDLVHTYLSPQVLDVLGYKPEEIIGKTPQDFMAPDEVERFSKIIMPTIESRMPFSRIIIKFLSKDGQDVFLEVSGKPIFDADGEYQGYRGLSRDVTGRVRP